MCWLWKQLYLSLFLWCCQTTAAAIESLAGDVDAQADLLAIQVKEWLAESANASWLMVCNMHDHGVSPVPVEPPSPITSPPASPAASWKCTSSGKPQQEETDRDFDEQEKSLGSHTLENYFCWVGNVWEWQSRAPSRDDRAASVNINASYIEALLCKKLILFTHIFHILAFLYRCFPTNMFFLLARCPFLNSFYPNHHWSRWNKSVLHINLLMHIKTSNKDVFLLYYFHFSSFLPFILLISFYCWQLFTIGTLSERIAHIFSFSSLPLRSPSWSSLSLFNP
jgi:hypothetical protein